MMRYRQPNTARNVEIHLSEWFFVCAFYMALNLVLCRSLSFSSA